ncbi:unnamed protein product [Amaranthus hypochondriacus]
MGIVLPYYILIIILCLRVHSLNDVEALLKLKNSFTNSESLNSWDPNTFPCKNKTNVWKGVICVNGVVIGLRLKSMGLSGNIDVDALSNLVGLRTLSFENNHFSGFIPQLNRLSSLKAIYLSDNQFEGNIDPDFFINMGSLKKLWLANNSFSGEIPSSLALLRNLVELHLENNRFSGIVPPLKQPPLERLNLSYNELEGQVPMSLLNFRGGSSFVGNPNLCGVIVRRDCTAMIKGNNHGKPPISPMTSIGDLKHNQEHNNIRQFQGILAIFVSVTVVLLSLVVLAIFIKEKRREKQDIPTSSKPKNKSNEAAVGIDVRGFTNISSSKGSRRRGGSNAGRGDFVIVNVEKGMFGLADLMKASAQVLGNGSMGSAYKAIMGNGLGVVVKRMCELNVLQKGDFDAHIRMLASFKHRNVLPPLAYHFTREEKLVIYEYVPKGSLHYLLHGDRGKVHEELNWATRLKIIKGIVEGLSFLHSQLKSLDIPHGNLKSSNIMITLHNDPLLMDYGFSPLTNPNVITTTLFGYRSPEVIQHNKVSPKCDVYCLGIVILEILTCKFPTQYLNATNGGTDVVQWVASAIEEGREVDVLDPDIVSNSTSCKVSMVKMLHIGADCSEVDDNKRPSLSQAKERVQNIDVHDGGGRDVMALNV